MFGAKHLNQRSGRRGWALRVPHHSLAVLSTQTGALCQAKGDTWKGEAQALPWGFSGASLAPLHTDRAAQTPRAALHGRKEADVPWTPSGPAFIVIFKSKTQDFIPNTSWKGLSQASRDVSGLCLFLAGESPKTLSGHSPKHKAEKADREVLRGALPTAALTKDR